MSHKEAPPETTEQRRMREFYTARGVNCGWGRGKSGAYLAPFAADAWAAWQAAKGLADSAPVACGFCADDRLTPGMRCQYCGRTTGSADVYRDPCFCECHGSPDGPCRKVDDCELCSPETVSAVEGK